MKKITIVIINNDSNIEYTLNNIFNQNINKENLEIVIEGDPKSDITINYPMDNIIVRENKSLANKLNDALKISTGDYITFINSDMYYEDKTDLNMIIDSEYKIISIESIYYDITDEKKKRYKMQPKTSGYIDLIENPHLLSLNFYSYFFEKKLIEKYKFDSKFEEECILKFLIDIFTENSEYYYFKELKLISTTPFEDNTSKSSIQYNPDWYIPSLKRLNNFFSKQKEIPNYIERILMYTIYAKYNCNIYDRNKNILRKEEDLPIFFAETQKLLSYISDTTIIDQTDSLYKTPRWLKYWFLNQKIEYLKSEPKYKIENDNIILEYINENKTNKIINDDIIKETISIQAINYYKGKLLIDCTTSVKDILPDEYINIEIEYNNKLIPIKKTEAYPLLKVFGKTIARKYPFQFQIDLSLDSPKEIKAFLKLNNKRIELNFNYKKVHARLSNSKRSFWHYKNFIIYNKVDKILIKKYNFLDLFISEIKFDLSKLKNAHNKKRVLKLIFLRLLYYITRPIYKNKHIWLTWDKLYKAGDNGEYMYQYCLKEGINIYYIVKKDSPDYERLKKANKKHTIVFNSLKAKLYALHSEIILDTHANVISYAGFDGIARHFACGLFNPEIICIQHGLTIQKIAQYQNRLFDNIKHYCCVSKYEIENIKDPLYDYDETQMTLTGAPRYDGLKAKDKKIILITPTWRRDVVNSSVAYIKKKHNDNFKTSTYYKIYNSLINNKELIECAKKNDYKIIYLLHPAMSGQLEDFNGNKDIEIIPAAGDVNYEKILTESSLMVTDYSGVQFDFAYQRKVLLYYHPDALPPHYDAGGLDYETMGFGPICKTEEKLVKELCFYMNNNCKIKKEYKDRADDFFAYNDFNNCQRTLETVKKYLKDLEQ